jgi:NAD(P)-dependent dehydrogenase (short-subunit alcohol dehydrogenase family)
MDLITTQEVYQEVKNLLDKKNNVSLENTNTYNLKKDEKVMKRKVVLILSISSDIGKYLAKRYSEQGDLVIGTYRKTKDLEELKQIPNCYLFFCDVDNETSIVEFVKKFNELNLNWDVFISCVGTPFPLQPFFKSNFDEWNKSFHTNSIEQLRVLYYLYPLRKKDEISNAVFFTGGGSPNKVAINISAYHVARMMLTKMCEILDAENKDLNVFIIGPGWVKTKTHNLILEKIDKTDKKYEITKNFMEKSQGTNMEDIFKCINSLCEQGKEVVGGRNISVVHDDWKNKEHFSNILKDNPDIFKLRRVEDSSLMENIDK